MSDLSFCPCPNPPGGGVTCPSNTYGYCYIDSQGLKQSGCLPQSKKLSRMRHLASLGLATRRYQRPPKYLTATWLSHIRKNRGLKSITVDFHYLNEMSLEGIKIMFKVGSQNVRLYRNTTYVRCLTTGEAMGEFRMFIRSSLKFDIGDVSPTKRRVAPRNINKNSKR